MEQAKLWLPKLLAGVVAIVLVLALFNIIKAFLPSPTPEIVVDLNHGLATKLFYDEEEGTDYTEEIASDFSGSLYFDSLALPDPEAGSEYEDATQAANIYRYDFVEGATIPVVEYGESFDGNPLNPTDIAFVTSLSRDGNTTEQAHVRLNTDTDSFVELAANDPDEAFELTVSPEDPSRIAFVFRSKNTANAYDINDYHILFDNPYSEQTITIEDAASPAWTMGGDVLVFLKKDGVYAYDLKRDVSGLLSNQYTDLGSADHIAVSASSTYAILTIPSLNTIAVFEPLTSESGDIIGINETGVIQTKDITYTSPVISPDNRFYAVVAAKETGSVIEIRHYLSRDVIATIVPEGTNPEYLSISAWSDYQVKPLALPTEHLPTTNELD